MIVPTESFLPTSLSQWVGMLGGITTLTVLITTALYRLAIAPIKVELAKIRAERELLMAKLNADIDGWGGRVTRQEHNSTSHEARILALEREMGLTQLHRESHSERMGKLDGTLERIITRLDEWRAASVREDTATAVKLGGLEAQVSGMKEQLDRLLERQS